MKILFLVTSDVTVSNFVEPQVRLLQARGHQVRVLSGRDPHQEVAVVDDWHHHINCGRSLLSAGDITAIFQIGRHIKQFEPDLVVAATPKASLLGIVTARVLRRSVPRIHLLWGLRSETMAGAKRHMVRGMERLTMRFSSRVLANSESLAREAVAQGITGSGAISVLGAGSSHGVDVGRFHPPLSPLVDRPFTVGFVGRVSRDKGVPELLQAAALLRERGTPILLHVVGPVEEPGALDGVSALSGVTLVGPTPVDADTYRDFDVLCLPSRREGFPNVCLEAAACSLPIVVSDATGCRDAVIHGVTGFHVPVGDAPALASRLSDLASDAPRRREMGLAGRRWVESEFEASVVLANYARFYESMN